MLTVNISQKALITPLDTKSTSFPPPAPSTKQITGCANGNESEESVDSVFPISYSHANSAEHFQNNQAWFSEE